MANLQFLGATGTVTGSKFVLEIGGSRAMIDCGVFQGLKEMRERNWQPFPINPASIGWVILTHAHIDHSGYLPRLVRDGFTGPVYTTNATADLLDILLPDSGKIQEEDADYANRKGFSKHNPAVPLYTEQDARIALKQVQSSSYNKEVRLSKFLSFRLIPAGHILGSSFVSAEITERDHDPIRILFSGDVGRYGEPILNDPSQVDEADYLLVESTYGNRLHEKTNPKERLSEIINATAERGGKIIIPAFAVGRTQLLVYYLRELEEEGRIPILPVAVDSPMGASVTRLYTRHQDDHDLNMKATLEDQPECPGHSKLQPHSGTERIQGPRRTAGASDHNLLFGHGYRRASVAPPRPLLARPRERGHSCRVSGRGNARPEAAGRRTADKDSRPDDAGQRTR